MSNEAEWKWEKLDDNSYRAKVIGGWLVSASPFTPSADKTHPSHNAVFIADRIWEWQIKKPQVDAPAADLSDFNPELF